MKISVIIPAYNEEEYIGACLDSVICHAGDRLHEIIVIDNASTDQTAEIASKRPTVKIVFERNKGLTRARQKGLEVSTGDFLAYIDADTRMPKNWLDKAIEVFSKEQDVVCLSGPYKYYDGTRRQRVVMNILWRVTAPLTYKILGYMVLGGNFIAKKSTLQAMGGFDKTIDFYGEDTDIARRLKKLGRVLFRMDFFIYSSIRRLSREGLIKTNMIYALNFIWEVLFHRPFSHSYQSVQMRVRNAQNKAAFWTGIFALIGGYAWIVAPSSPTVLPLGIFYLTLIINTYFSIKLFASITPVDDTRNNLLDIVLGLSYLFMAFNFSNPTEFVFLSLLLFIVAAAKYVFLLGTIEHFSLLRKKILIDISGTLACALTLGGIIAGYAFYSLWALTIIFMIANMILFFIWPLRSKSKG